jgi:hypothetical protein
MATMSSILPSSLPPSVPGASRGLRLGLAFASWFPSRPAPPSGTSGTWGTRSGPRTGSRRPSLPSFARSRRRLEEIVRNPSSVQEERHTQLLRRFRRFRTRSSSCARWPGPPRPGSPRSATSSPGEHPHPGRLPGASRRESGWGPGRRRSSTRRRSPPTTGGAWPRPGSASRRSWSASRTTSWRPDARYYLADIAAREGDLDDALRRFMQVAELHPTAPRVPEALYRAALIHRDRGRGRPGPGALHPHREHLARQRGGRASPGPSSAVPGADPAPHALSPV